MKIEPILKKTALFLGLASVIYATSVFATNKSMTHTSKSMTPIVSKPVAMCMVHGKKVHCAVCTVHGKTVYWVHGKKVHCMPPVKHHAIHHVTHPAKPVKKKY